MKTTLIGKKIGMTQVYGEDNQLVPVTVIEAGPCPVIQVKTTESDGYNAIQIGYGVKKEKNTSKALLGHLKKAGQKPFAVINEIRLDAAPEQAVGDALTVEAFAEARKVDVIGIVKGRGFQGVVRRYNMDGQPASHGHMMHRRPGSIGMRQTPGHVFKGKKMPGHMGQVRRTVQNLKVVRVDAEKNLILVKGSIPGANGTTVLVRTAVKQKKSA
ncbi:MAG: 50S ribosomal protein L3 [Opitutales bacterium]